MLLNGWSTRHPSFLCALQQFAARWLANERGLILRRELEVPGLVSKTCQNR
jgi:hypothetical protein